MSNQDLPVEDERTDSVPKAAPTYADDEMRTLGDRLAALYDAQAADPGAPVADEIARIRARMRKGPRLRAGEFLKDGRYRLIERSRTGSADGYWKAWDRVSADLVLVRVFHGDWVGDPTAIARFKERGDQLEQLVHPNIGGVLDADRTDDGFVYVAATYFTSGDLAHAQLDATDAIQVSLEVAQALRHAHEHGVVHGDVRPSNVMLSADGSAHLVGFSIEAKAPEATSVYRAPEATEDSYVPAAPADVYALGMTALAALHRAELPFWVLRDPSRLIRGLAVGETVKAVLTRATDWDLGVRYPTISALLDDWLSDHELVSSLAVRARARGRHPIAAQHYEKLLEIQPGRGVEIRTILGDVYMAMGAYDRAMTHLLAALERTSDVEALFAPLRIAAEHTGDWSKLAEALWTQARARDAGRRVVLRIELAKINFDKLQNPVASAETWSQVLADHRTPDQAVIALRSLCDLAKLRQDWVGFTEYSQELLEYVPEDERSRIEYAIGRVFLEHLSDETRGLEFIDRAEAVGYTELELAPRMQGIRAKRGQWKRVIQLMVMQAATQDIGEASPTLLRAGIIASAVHLEEEAFTVYHALLERAPKHVVALRHVARLHHRAHEQDKALRYYERLWETYKGKDSEEPEASERAADCTAYAGLLLKNGHGDDAAERLAHALKLNPNHVPSLQLAGPLYLSRGDVGQAGVVFDRLLSLFKSVELSAQKIEACLGMGDLAWVQGRLTAAMGWYNRAIELDPFSVQGWWGLAKVALASRGGHPGADRAPWVMAIPKRYTGFEALARMFAGLLDPAAMRSWLGLTPLGQAMLDGGETAMRASCAVVDLLARNELVAPDLFQRLGEAFPDWRGELDEIQQLWIGGQASTFPIARSYGWSRRLVEDDFDIGGPGVTAEALARTVLPPELVPPVAGASVLRTTEAWGVLLGGRRPVAPEPFVPPSDDAPARSTRYAGPVGALVRDGNLWLALRRDQPSASIGSNHDTDLRIVDDPAIDPAHARLFRQGGRIYVEAAAPHSRVQVDGEQRDRWRLIGGERVTLGETRLQYQVFEDESRLPPPVNGVAVNAGPKADPRPSKPDAAAPRVEVAPKATEAKPESAKQEAKPESAKSEARSEPTPPRAEPRSEPPREPTPNPPNRAETPRPPSNRAVSPSSAPASGPSSPPPVSSSPVDPAASPGPSTTSSFRPASAGVSLDDHVDEWSPGWGPAEHEPARLLEPTAALRLDGLRDLTDDGDDELGSGELTVPLSAVAEAESANEEVTVQIPEGTSSDVPDDPNPDAETEPEPEPTPAESDERTEGVDELGDEPPSEEEVIQAVNGRVAHSAMIRMAHGEPVHEPQKLMTVMDDGSVETGPIPEDMLREALGMPPLGPLDEDVNPDLPTAPVWYQIDDGDSDDEDDEDGPVDDTTAVISRSDPANPDRVPTLIEASPPLQPHPTQPVFGFSGDVQDDDVSKLVAEPPKVARGVVSSGPTVVPVEREALPGRLPGATTSGSMPPQRAPSLPPGSIGRIPRTGTSLPPIGAGGGAGGEVTTPLQGRASLEFMSGPDRGKRITVGETVTVGQSRSCEISIPSDVRLSPVHCKIARTRDGFVVTDEGSANGTVVNGARITRFALHGGEVIVIGRTVLRFRVEGA